MSPTRAVVAIVIAWSFAAAASAQTSTEPRPLPASACDSAPATASVPDARRRLAMAAGERGRRDGLIVRPSDPRRDVACPPGADSRAATAPRPGDTGRRIRPLPADWRVLASMRYPTDRNNGALWSARGVASIVGAGVTARWGPLSAAVAPRAVFWRAAGDARSAPPSRLDLERPTATEPTWRMDPGQSFARLDAFGVKLGVSTENLWWGPAKRYPLLLGSTAPGFPHAFIGTMRPTAVGIGTVDAELVWGHLHASDGFAVDSGRDRSLFAGAVAVLTPRGLDALSIGVARVYLSAIPPEGLPVGDYLRRPYTRITANPLGDVPLADNEFLSLFIRWAFPAIGLDAYAEWARDDFWGGGQDLLLELDHSQGYMLGIEKRVAISDRPARLTAEAASLGSGKSVLSRRPGTRFYTHSALRQGYTHAGQLLGAWIGPGADAQFLALDVLTDRGSIGAYVERVRRQAGWYYNRWAERYGAAGHDVALGAGVRGARRLGPIDLSWDVEVARRWNRGFAALRGGEIRAESNLQVDIGATWWPGDEDVVTVR